MLTISSYLLRQFLVASGAVLAGLVVMWIAVDSLLHIDELAELGGIGAILERALEVLPLGVPMACLVGAVWSLTRAVRFREVTAIRAGGIPLRRTLLPLLAASALLALGLGVLEDRVIVKGRQRAHQEQAAEQTERPRPGWRNGAYWYANGPYVLSAAEFDEAKGELVGVTVFELGPERETRARIDAQRAVFVDGNTWEFRDVVVYEFTDNELARREAISLQLDLRLSGAQIAPPPRPVDRETLHKLARRIREAGADRDLRAQLETAFHGRLAQPLAVLLLVLLAIPFAIGDVERGDSLPRALVSSLAVAVAFWGAWTLTLTLAQTGWLAPALVVWGFIAATAALGSWRFSLVPE